MPCALPIRSEEHTSELQSHDNLVCRLLLEKKNRVGGGENVRLRIKAFALRLFASLVLTMDGNMRSQKVFFFFFNDTATTEIYTLSLHDALPISATIASTPARRTPLAAQSRELPWRSEEHTSELQSHDNLVCRLLLEKKNRQ